MPNLSIPIPDDFGEMSIEDLDDYITEKIDQITRKLILDLFTLLVVWTPADTGRARAGWGIAKRSPSTSEPGEGDYFPEPRPSRNVFKPSDLLIWYITNNVSYIEVLDDGRSIRDGQMRGSEQAPTGMTSLALQELERSML
jgi:hypothetical protein